MAQEQFRLPSLGMNMEEATITEWHVGVVTVETDKVTTALPSPFGGSVVEIHAQPDQTIPVGAPLVTFET
jgi:pyruvate dehydrogenase E2 component (dihydrolipoamide acetyltransferase)